MLQRVDDDGYDKYDTQTLPSIKRTKLQETDPSTNYIVNPSHLTFSEINSTPGYNINSIINHNDTNDYDYTNNHYNNNIVYPYNNLNNNVVSNVDVSDGSNLPGYYNYTSNSTNNIDDTINNNHSNINQQFIPMIHNPYNHPINDNDNDDSDDNDIDYRDNFNPYLYQNMTNNNHYTQNQNNLIPYNSVSSNGDINNIISADNFSDSSSTFNRSPYSNPNNNINTILTPLSSSSTTTPPDIVTTVNNKNNENSENNVPIIINICWGMIETSAIVMKPRPCTGGIGYVSVELERNTKPTATYLYIFVKANGEAFGTVEPELAKTLTSLMDDNLIWTEAYISKEYSISDTLIPLYINIYGHPDNTSSVSNHLFNNNVTLKNPIVEYNKNTRYSNPHYPLSVNRLISENTLPLLKNMNINNFIGGRSVNVNSILAASGGVSTKVASDNVKNQIDSVFNSLMNSDDISEAQPDERLITPLYKHQKQALFFLLEREKFNDFTNEETNALTSLWRTRRNADRYLVYYNVVTDDEIDEKPSQMRGGIVADDMGLGKTIQIIALVLGTLEEARKFSNVKPKPNNKTKSTSPTFLNSSLITTANDNSEKKPNINDYDDSELSDSDSYVESTDGIKSRGTLIICPLSTISNWEDQFTSHVKSKTLSIYVYHGGTRISDPSLLVDYDIVLTTYNVTGTEYNKQTKNNITSALQKIHWFRIVLDEAHVIKDVNTVQSKAACSLNAERRWCLTGTPIQNKLDDLFALIKFLHMSPFDKKENWNYYISKPIKTIDSIGLNRLQTLMKCIMLRRKKFANGRQLLALPPKKDHITYLELDEYERKLYNKVHSRQTKKLKIMEENNNVMQNYVNILASILRLRQICAHFSLIGSLQIPDDLDDDNDGVLTIKRAVVILELFRESGLDQCCTCSQYVSDVSVITKCEHLFCVECAKKSMEDILKKIGDVIEVKDSLFDEIKNSKKTIKQEIKTSTNVTHSTKVKALIADLLAVKINNTKSVVFSQWTKLLDLIEVALKENDLTFTRLDGTMNRLERAQNIECFKASDKVNVILVSLKAGGVGIHRLGQTAPVDTIRFIIKDSVEENILKLQSRKLKLAELTLSQKLSKKEIAQRRLEDLKVLFK
ncbi:15922_t:CDS:10 [Entrophospora sp. SA101]|nr:15922_t:CDS:10 [Entrophospora sp. SA101]